MAGLVLWPVILPLITGFFLILMRNTPIGIRRLFNLLSLAVLVGLSFWMLTISQSGEYQVYLVGNWSAPFGIVLVADKLSSLMVALTTILAVGSLWYAIATGLDKHGLHFHTLFQLLLFGLNGALLTGDLFNLFVFFEVLLLASYGLLLHGGGRHRNKAGLHYVVINLVGSSLFLIGVGVLYGVLGTLNIADLAFKVATAPQDSLGLLAAAGLLLLIVFSIKAAVFPFYLWLPGAYTHTSAAIAAFFAIMTKVGLYAIIRVHGTIFGEQAGELAHYHLPWLLGLGLVTLTMAALGALASSRLRQQIAYLVLASVGTLLIGIGLNSHEALSGSLYYLIHSTLIAAGMFLLADVIRNSRGDFRDHFEAGLPIKNAVIIGSTFMFGAVALAGMPPLSGFIGKALILQAAMELDNFVWIFVVVLFSSLLLIVALARAGSLLFYRPNIMDPPSEGRKPFKPWAFAAALALFAAAPLMVIFAGEVTDFTARVAWQHFNSFGYLEAVLTAKPIGYD